MIIVIVVVVILWIVYREVSKSIKLNKERKNPKVTVADAERDIQIEKDKGESLSSSASAYSASANAIEKLLDGCETSESETSAISNVMQVVKRPIDWFNLVKVFGVREISQCGSFGQIKDSYDLPTLLKDQLDTVVISTSGIYADSLVVLRNKLKEIGVTI